MDEGSEVFASFQKNLVPSDHTKTEVSPPNGAIGHTKTDIGTRVTLGRIDGA